MIDYKALLENPCNAEIPDEYRGAFDFEHNIIQLMPANGYVGLFTDDLRVWSAPLDFLALAEEGIVPVGGSVFTKTGRNTIVGVQYNGEVFEIVDEHSLLTHHRKLITLAREDWSDDAVMSHIRASYLAPLSIEFCGRVLDLDEFYRKWVRGMYKRPMSDEEINCVIEERMAEDATFIRLPDLERQVLGALKLLRSNRNCESLKSEQIDWLTLSCYAAGSVETKDGIVHDVYIDGDYKSDKLLSSIGELLAITRGRVRVRRKGNAPGAIRQAVGDPEWIKETEGSSSTV